MLCTSILKVRKSTRLCSEGNCEVNKPKIKVSRVRVRARTLQNNSFCFHNLHRWAHKRLKERWLRLFYKHSFIFECCKARKYRKKGGKRREKLPKLERHETTGFSWKKKRCWRKSEQKKKTWEIIWKTWEIFQKISHVFQIISHVFFFCSDILQNYFRFQEKPVVLCRSCFGSSSRLLPPLFLYFLALQYEIPKECLQSRRNHLCFSRLRAHLWRLWKQKVLFCRVRARTRTRETLILRLFTSQFPSGHSRVGFLTFKIEVQSLFPATVCS